MMANKRQCVFTLEMELKCNPQASAFTILTVITVQSSTRDRSRLSFLALQQKKKKKERDSELEIKTECGN